ncbi:hypothetical protein M1146_04985 [Patescibacteria group bacterium]|nr:hypothetical protein [Patescibacteria group bacterium]
MEEDTVKVATKVKETSGGSYPVVNAWNEWDPLEEVIVGELTTTWTLPYLLHPHFFIPSPFTLHPSPFTLHPSPPAFHLHLHLSNQHITGTCHGAASLEMDPVLTNLLGTNYAALAKNGFSDGMFWKEVRTMKGEGRVKGEG